MARPAVLVTDAEERSSLAACRALAAAGFDVTAGASRRPAAGAWSRAATRSVVLASPVSAPAAFVGDIERVLRERAHDVLLPASDAALAAISEERERLEPRVRIGLPPREVVDRVTSKVALLELAAAAGLPAPASVVVGAWPEARDAAASVGYPVVAKPLRNVLGGRYQRVVVARDELELASAAPDLGSPFVVQRYEPDAAIYSCAGVAIDGALAAVGLARYARTWPPSAGSASRAETVSLPRDLDEAVGRFVGASGWQGIFEFELLRDPSGAFAAIDFNPRVYGSLGLLVAAGANLPAIWCKYVLEGVVPPRRVVAGAGFGYRVEDAELRHAARRLAHGQLRAAALIARPRPRTVHAFFARRDPLPLVARLIELGRVSAAARPARLRRREARVSGGIVTGLEYAAAYLVAAPLFGLTRLEGPLRRALGARSSGRTP